MKTNFTKVSSLNFSRIATLLAVGIAVSIGVPALAAVSRTTVKPNTTSSSYIRGGTEDNGRNILYVCSAIVDGEYTPGKYYPPNGRCYVSWGGKEYYPSSRIYLYKANSWTWGNFPGYTVGNNPVGGTENNGKNKLYFCRAKVDGEYTPGKYYPPNKTCYIPWGGREYQFKNFQILFAN
ncbi:MAG: DM9 repeat-containing protein [Nostoc sp.]|uniref:DM9 repeat-containing protein n=1 Tax=Nostoc sp. TaxID=1180 RepID=UPI002FF62F9C